MGSPYHNGSRELQDRFDTRRLADRLEEKFLARPVIDAEDRAFIERMDMFFLATADADGRPQCSYKGGDAGFVRVLDEHTVAFPNYDGNGMYLSMGNLLVNPHVGMLFIDFVSARLSRLRLNGIASVDQRDQLIDHYPGAQFVVRVSATQVFPNCPRYIHRMALIERSRFVPRADREPPIPDWKRSAWACDVLPDSTPRAAIPTRGPRATREWRTSPIARCSSRSSLAPLAGHRAPPRSRPSSNARRCTTPSPTTAGLTSWPACSVAASWMGTSTRTTGSGTSSGRLRTNR